jgi:sugar fermentation stimulation protein A
VSAAQQKTHFTLVGGYYAGRAMSLYSARANQIARELVLPALIPEARSVRAEPVHEGGRFDFAVETEHQTHLVEVKACTLIHADVGMFPDAVSARAARHLHTLAGTDAPTHVVFVLMRPDASRFIPDLHTDPTFALALRAVADRVNIHAVAVESSPEGEVRLANAAVAIDLDPVKFVDEDRGVYLLVVERHEDCVRRVGALGELHLPAGYYVYTGSAMRGLRARVERHRRRRKKAHWHIDSITVDADRVRAFPIYTANDLECALATRIREVAAVSGGKAVAGFGCSDCRCESHLVCFPTNPMRSEGFVSALLDFRHDYALRSTERADTLDVSS